MNQWTQDDGLCDITSAFQGVTVPTSELLDDIHRRGWTVNKVHIKDGQYLAEGKNPHGETLEAAGRTDATAIGNLLVKVMRREHMRSSAVKTKLGAWDHQPIERQLSAIAMAYAGAPVYEPKAAPAWMDLAQDCTRRAQTVRSQIQVEYTHDPTPYESADAMREDVTQKRKLTVSRAYPHHPVWSESQVLDYRLVVDVLGHAIGGGDWGWHGTCLAFAALAPLFAEQPQKALFTELLGQSAFGTFYRQWGPQKICFLEELVEKEQEQNKPGHSGVHPSQSIVPMKIPGIFSKVAMAERSGNPTLDAAIAEFMSQHRGELGDIQDYRHPQVAWGQCELVAEECAQFLESKGFKASVGDGDLDELGYQDAKPSESVMTPQGPAGEFTYPEHAVVCVYNEHNVLWWTIDFTAAQYGYNEFPKVEPGPPGPLIGPQRESTSAVVGAPTDPNADWESGVQPLPDNAYLWQRINGIDPLDIQSTQDNLRPLDMGIANMHPQMAKQAVVNALRSSLLGSRSNALNHAIHYQDLMGLPADVDDPIAYWDTLEQRRSHWNQGAGYPPDSHKQYWPEEQQFKQWVKAANPQLDDGEVQRVAKRELLHMMAEEEERILAKDQGEELPNEMVEHEVYEALRKRLKALTKANVDQKVDFGEDHLYHEAGINHSLGEPGKGVVHNGDLHTWPEDWGTHDEYLRRVLKVPYRDQVDTQKFHIRPDGSVFGATELVTAPLSNATIQTELSKVATHHADMYPPYLVSRLRPIAQVSRNANALADAAREDLTSHKGHGHHFRSTALSLGIPQLGPRQVSNAWLHLAPQTSQLGVIDPQLMEILGHDYLTDASTRDYFKHERELAAGRDASGYNHVPLGPFSAALWDQKAGGPGWHPDRTPFKVHAPAQHHTIDWNAQTPAYPDWQEPYWWASTQEARDGAAKEFDRNVATQFGRDDVPFQKVAAYPPPGGTHECPNCGQGMVPNGWRGFTGVDPEGAATNQMSWSCPGCDQSLRAVENRPVVRSPWVTDPTTSQRVTGPPGASLMSHLKQTFGHPNVQEVWNQDYEVGKDAGGRIAKVAMAERSGFPDLDQAIAEFMQTNPEIAELRDPQLAWGQCQEIAEE